MYGQRQSYRLRTPESLKRNLAANAKSERVAAKGLSLHARL